MSRRSVHSHEDLEVWRLSMRLAADIYRGTRRLPASEQYGLQTQIRRAAVSIPSNIAEGAARSSSADFSRFLAIAMGSLAELQTQLLLCEDLEFLKHEEAVHQRIRVVRLMLSRLRASLRHGCAGK